MARLLESYGEQAGGSVAISRIAVLYGAETRLLVQAVKRNLERFPEDFMFQLSQEKFAILRSQFVTLNKRRGNLAVTRRQILSQVVVTIIQNPIASRKSSDS